MAVPPHPIGEGAGNGEHPRGEQGLEQGDLEVPQPQPSWGGEELPERCGAAPSGSGLVVGGPHTLSLGRTGLGA